MFQKLTKTLKKAFTITELVIVIAVIAVLAAVLIPTFSNVISSANQSAALSTCKNALTDLEGTKANAGETSEDLYGTGFCCNGYYFVFFMGQLWYLGTIDLDAEEVERGEAAYMTYGRIFTVERDGTTGATVIADEDGERTYIRKAGSGNHRIHSVEISAGNYDYYVVLQYYKDSGAETYTTVEYMLDRDTIVVAYELSVNSTLYAGMFAIETGSENEPVYQTEGATYSSEGIIIDGSLLYQK